jgi:hypothetical protein
LPFCAVFTAAARQKLSNKKIVPGSEQTTGCIYFRFAFGCSLAGWNTLEAAIRFSMYWPNTCNERHKGQHRCQAQSQSYDHCI